MALREVLGRQLFTSGDRRMRKEFKILSRTAMQPAEWETGKFVIGVRKVEMMGCVMRGKPVYYFTLVRTLQGNRCCQLHF